MESSIHTITPLRQRMIDDMRMRKFAPHTQAHQQQLGRKSDSPDCPWALQLVVCWQSARGQEGCCGDEFAAFSAH